MCRSVSDRGDSGRRPHRVDLQGGAELALPEGEEELAFYVAEGSVEVTVRRPEKETHPKLFYRGAHQTTLDPLAAVQPEGGLFLWSEQSSGNGLVVSGSPGGAAEAGGLGTGSANSSAAAVLAYDIAHRVPWDWRVSLYTLTKGIASGSSR